MKKRKCPFKNGCCCALKEFVIYGAECNSEEKEGCLLYQAAKKGIESEED